MRQYLGVVIGVVLGAVGVLLFGQSLPPEEGSESARVESAEQQLRRAQAEIRELRASGARTRNSGWVEKQIFEDIRSGRGASLDDLFAVSKPWLRKIAPIINLGRIQEERSFYYQLAGEYGREYDLSEQQQRALRMFLNEKARENAAAFTTLVESEGSTFYDLMLASRELERNRNGIDQFMERQLAGEQLDAYRQDRLLDRIESVEREANGRLNRLDHIVDLDAEQEDALFFLLARGAEDYSPGMEIEGMGGERAAILRDGQVAAIQAALRPEQRERFDSHRADRRTEAEQDLREVGLRLPRNWEQFIDDEW